MHRTDLFIVNGADLEITGKTDAVLRVYGRSPPLQESCDPSNVLVCSDLHFCLTSFII